jgi:hypothetical protein
MLSLATLQEQGAHLVYRRGKVRESLALEGTPHPFPEVQQSCAARLRVCHEEEGPHNRHYEGRDEPEKEEAKLLLPGSVPYRGGVWSALSPITRSDSRRGDKYAELTEPQ